MKKTRTPWWFAALLIVVGLPALYFNNVAARTMADGGWISADVSTWLYPAYVFIAGFSAWICYSDRRALAWVLFSLILLTDIAFIVVGSVGQ